MDPRKVRMKILKGQPCYTSCLDRIRGLLLQPEKPTADDVEQLLGHGVLAGSLLKIHLHVVVQDLLSIICVFRLSIIRRSANFLLV